MPIASITIQEELVEIVAILGVIWVVFIVSRIVPKLNCYGVIPRESAGLAGIPIMPFLHYDLTHILSNTVPLVVLLVLLVVSRTRPWLPVVAIVLLGGFLLWLVGRRRIHIGASGLIFGLIAFLIVCGLREGQLVSFGIAVLVGFTYGGTLVSGVLPRLRSYVSWEAHLCGAVAGGIVAFILTGWA